MKTLTVRGVDDALYEHLRQESSILSVSMNRFLLDSLIQLFAKNKVLAHSDFDRYLSSWDEKNYQEVMGVLADFEKIDQELWS